MAPTLLPLGIVAAIGAVLGIYFPSLTLITWCSAVICFLTSILLFFVFHKKHLLAQFLLYLAFGCGWCGFVSIHTTRPLNLPESVSVYTVGKLIDDPQQVGHNYAFPLRVKLSHATYNVQAYSHLLPAGLKSGDSIHVTGTLRSFDASDGADNHLLRSATSNVQAILTVHSSTKTYTAPPSRFQFVFRFRDAINESIRNSIYSRMTGESAVLCESLLLGNYQQLGSDTIADFRRTGLVHLLALSGLQMMMIWGIFEGFASIIRLPFKWRIAFILCGVLFYRFLLPSIASVDRALYMALWFIGARIAGVKLSGWQAWGGALLTQSLIMPQTVVTPGFQLSFAAVAGLLCITPLQKHLFRHDYTIEHPQTKFFQWLVYGVLTSLAAIVATTPFLIYHFGYISYIGLLWNIPAIPLSGLILLGTILLCVFSWAGAFAQLLATATERSGDLMLWFARFPGSSWGPGSSAFGWSLLFAVAFFLWVYSVGTHRKLHKGISYLLVVASVTGYLITSSHPTREQIRLNASLLPDPENCVYVSETTHDAASFVRSWLREFGDKPLTVLVLHDQLSSNIPVTTSITVKYAADFDPGTYAVLTTHIVWQSVYTEETEEMRSGWGVITDAGNNHYFHYHRLPSTVAENLGWNWQLPQGRRYPINPAGLPGSYSWLVKRWNMPETSSNFQYE